MPDNPPQWVEVGNIKGPAGEQGDPGAKGDEGDPGPAGNVEQEDPTASRNYLDVYSREEVQNLMVPAAELGSARIESQVSTPANTALFDPAGLVPGFAVTVTGTGAPAVLYVSVPALRHPVSFVSMYVLCDGSATGPLGGAYCGGTGFVNSAGLGLPLHIVRKPLGVLPAGVSHTFAVGFRTRTAGQGTIDASNQYPATIAVCLA